jgi:hypothetical protein
MTALTDFTTAFTTFIAAAATFAATSPAEKTVTVGAYSARVNATVLTRVGSTVSETPAVGAADLAGLVAAYVAANPTMATAFIDLDGYRLQIVGGVLASLVHE